MKVLYDTLVNLCNNTEAFFFDDQKNLDGIYRIFNYRLASYTDFLQEGAMSCRGICFQIDDNGEYVNLVSRPMDKFFNYGENPFTMLDPNILSNEIEMCLDKLDGSLISSFMNTNFKVQLKSKGSFISEHAILANKLILENKKLENEVTALEVLGYTSNFELLSPKLRIVIPYKENQLRLLNARNRKTGEYLTIEQLKNYPELLKSSVLKDGYISSNAPIKNTVLETVQAIHNMTGIEGFVIKLRSGLYFKVKTSAYCALHHNKDSITVASRLFDVVLEDASDDLRQMFEDDDQAIESIERMEKLVFNTYNSIAHEVETFYNENKNLDRKVYALKVQKELDSSLGKQGLAFALYSGKTPDYKLNMQKQMKTILVNY